MAQLDPDLLRTFVTIVEDGNFRRAAEKVGRTQSAVSMQVQRLEEACGHRLFSRDRPAARLTPKGEALLGYARRLLSLQAEALADLSGTLAQGKVRFGMPDDYATGLLPRILTRFADDHPRIEVEITCATSPQLHDMLTANELDLAIITRTPGRPAGQRVFEEPLVWVTSRLKPVGDVSPVPVAFFQPDCMARKCATDALTEIGRPFRIAYSSPNLAALLAIVDAGLAVAAMPAGSVPKSCKTLGARDGFPPLPGLQLGLIRNMRAAASAIDALADSIGSLATER